MRVAICLFAIAACVPRKGDGTIGQAESQKAGQTLAAGIEGAAAAYGPVATGAGVDASCITLSGDTSDPDADSIPNNATKTFNCTATSLGYTGMLTGTQNVVDGQPNAIAWAFTGAATLHASLTGPGGASITVDTNGNIVASQMTIAGPYRLARMLDVTTVFTGGRDLGGPPTTTTVDEAVDWTITYTPQIMWTPGTIVVTGSLSATGTWDVSVDDEKTLATANATLATPTPLTLNPACETRVTAGTVAASYGRKSITVTWTACGQSTVTYAE